LSTRKNELQTVANKYLGSAVGVGFIVGKHAPRDGFVFNLHRRPEDFCFVKKNICVYSNGSPRIFIFFTSTTTYTSKK